MKRYDMTTVVWRVDPEDFPADEPLTERARFLFQHAILAPSSHNSQPWEFVIEDGQIEIHATEDRWLEVVDRDKREFYISRNVLNR